VYRPIKLYKLIAQELIAQAKDETYTALKQHQVHIKFVQSLHFIPQIKWLSLENEQKILKF